MSTAVDLFLDDMRAQGRINSDRSERSYRGTLARHAEDVGNRDPRTTTRQDVKRTLARWRHPNTHGTCRAHLVSFYRWLVWEGLRGDNPAEQTQPPRRRRPSVYRLTRAEVVALIEAAASERQRRVILIGVCAGLRRQELRGLQGRHFQRSGWVWVSADIGKGGHERWVPALPELRPVAESIRRRVALDEYVLPAQRWRDPGVNRVRGDLRRWPASEQALWRLVGSVGRQAGIAAAVKPHMLRHAFADHVARHAGVRNAQKLLGHADLGTTETYLGEPTLDDLATAVDGLSFFPGVARRVERAFSPVPGVAAVPLEATTGIEPVDSSDRAVERFSVVLRGLFASPVLRGIARGMA